MADLAGYLQNPNALLSDLSMWWNSPPPDIPRWPIPPVAPSSDMTTPRDIRQAIIEKVRREEAERERIRTIGGPSPGYGGFRAPGGFYTEPTSEFTSPRDLKTANINALFGWDTTNPVGEFASRLENSWPVALGAMPTARYAATALSSRLPGWMQEAFRVGYHPAANIPGTAAIYSVPMIGDDLNRLTNTTSYWAHKYNK